MIEHARDRGIKPFRMAAVCRRMSIKGIIDFGVRIFQEVCTCWR